MYRADADAVVILEPFQKTSPQIPERVLDICRRRLADYGRLSKGGE